MNHVECATCRLPIPWIANDLGPAGAGPTLPPPEGMDIGDVAAIVFKLSSEMNESSAAMARGRAIQHNADREAASERRRELLARAVEAAKKAAEARDEGGFFDFITDNLGPVGLVGMVVGAAYIVAADVAMHAAGLDNGSLDIADAGGLACMMAGPAGVLGYAAQLCAKRLGPEEFQRALDDLGTIKDDDVRGANKLAFALTQAHYALAATVGSGGTTAPAVVAMVGIGISAATEIAEQTGALEEVFGEDAKWVALGGAVAGAACTMTGGIWMAATNAGRVNDLISAVDKAKTALEAAHDIEQGISNLEAAGYQREADDLDVDAREQRQIMDLVEAMVDQVIDDMKAIAKSSKRTSEICAEINLTRGQTLLTAGSLRG